MFLKLFKKETFHMANLRLLKGQNHTRVQKHFWNRTNPNEISEPQVLRG